MERVHFTITLSGVASDHDEDLGDAVIDLRNELAELAGVQIQPAPAPEPVRPTRSPNDFAAYTGLAVVIGATVVRPTVDVLKAWLNRHKDKNLKLELSDGSTLSANGYSSEELEKLLNVNSEYSGND